MSNNENLQNKEELQVQESATKVVNKSSNPEEKRQRAPRNNQKDEKRRPNRSSRREFQAQEFEEKVIDIARVTVVVKGGRRFSFSAHVVVGNRKGKVGFGHGKANEVQDAIKKAVKDAHKNIFEVPIVNGTVPHEVETKFLASKVQLRPAPKGVGFKASNTVRSVMELAGYTDVSTKSLGSRTKQNVAHAVVKALKQLRTAQQIADLRDIKVEDLQ
ncbi:30S ribosomal protein S5 [[Mycoplasma] gypis]|uniref:30S ribosomal protein S5 n=1 Tax=[Mycoplasma] gypis TaxID=92404 RepID=UPI0019686432|nr:30S ribosomal protein S5 [[Mycoplasma] gypis]